MNYLAHAYLSFNKPDVLAGNMISDYIKGKKQYDYPKPVQVGIKLHRAIDNYTDTHEATRQLKVFFRPQYRLYAGAFADVVYDHFLALDSKEFTDEDALRQFSQNTYNLLEGYTDIFPVYFKSIYPYMREQNWLLNYRHTWAIEKSFGGVARRSVYLTESRVAFDLFLQHYDSMHACYDAFFADVKFFAAGHLDELLTP